MFDKEVVKNRPKILARPLYSITMRYLITLLLVLICTSSFGDTYSLPKDTFYKSDNGKFLFKVEPRSPFENENEESNYRKFTYGTLYKIQASDTLEIWKTKLINRYAPPQVFVANNGRYIVTSGEWYGTSEFNTIVIYNESGKIIKKHDFYDIVPKGLIFERISVTRLFWKRRMYFKNKNSFVIEIVSNGHEKGNANFEKLKIDLITGRVIKNKKLILIAEKNKKKYNENAWDYFKIPPPPNGNILDIID